MKQLKQLISATVMGFSLFVAVPSFANLPTQSVSYSTVGEPLFIAVRALEKSMGVPIVLRDVDPDKMVNGQYVGINGAAFLDNFTQKNQLAWLYQDGKVLLIPQGADLTRYKQVAKKEANPSSFTRIVYDPKDKNKYGLMIFQIHNAWADDKSLTMSGGATTVPGVARLFSQFVGIPMVKQGAESSNGTKSASVPKEKPVSSQSFKEQQVNLLSLFTKNVPANTATEAPSDDPTLSINVRGVYSEGRLNAILVRDKIELFETYKQIIALLDRPVDMVQMDAYIVDIEKSKAGDYGVNFGIGGAGTGRNLILNGLTATKFLNNLSLIETKKEGHLLSVPSVVSMNNLEASFSNRQNFYVKVEGNNDATLNKVTAETLLRVTPLIANENDNVPYHQRRIKLNINIQDAVADSSTSIPSTKENQITTQATIRSGDTLVIGGQVISQRVDAKTGLPILGDLPVVGGLFSSRSVVVKEYIRIYIVRPQILGEDSVSARSEQ